MASEQSWRSLARRWAPGLLSTPVMLLAYVGLAVEAPRLLATRGGFLVGLSLVSAIVSVVIAGSSRWLGLYAPDARGEPRHNPQRQGITATQLALLLSALFFPRFNVDQPWWVYVLAYFLLGAVGMATFALIAGQQATSASSSASTPSARRPRRPTEVAPAWVQRLARICLGFGILALVRLATDQELTFLWVGLGLISVALVFPSLVVALGGGVPADVSARGERS